MGKARVVITVSEPTSTDKCRGHCCPFLSVKSFFSKRDDQWHDVCSLSLDEECPFE